jgi:hypothetical protein
MKYLLTQLMLTGFIYGSFAQSVSDKHFIIKKQGTVDLNSSDKARSNRADVKEMPKQGISKNNPNQKSFVLRKQATVDLSANTRDFNPHVMVKEMPHQKPKKIEYYNYPPYSNKSSHKSSSVLLSDLDKNQTFFGNPFWVSTPCDNDMAISDSGMVISVMNTNIFVRNTTTSVSPFPKGLNSFSSPINNFHQEFDPKVMYDPLKDRFVLVCLVGNVDTTSKVIIGFSKTNNPNGLWNLYSLPGDPLNYGLWSDYPMIAMTEKELFLTVNLLYNDSTWQAGFVETLIWQIGKDSGYAGNNLPNVLHSNVKYNGKAVRNLCPVKGGSKLYKPNMYFVSNRNLASQNDTVFLVNVTDTIGSSTNTVTVKALVSNQPYYFPPDGRQTFTSQALATNDSRNLGAYFENNKIHYVHNTKNPGNNLCTIYYGVIDNPQSTTPTVQGYLIANDTMDFAYPNISYAGDTTTDHTSIITFDHTSNKLNAGISAIKTDGNGNYSKILRIKNGATYVDLLTGSLERWGDYSGSQRRYNKPGEVWMSGYYAYNHSSYPRAHGAWITQLGVDSMVFYVPPPPPPADTTAIIENQAVANNMQVFPNPIKDIFSVEFSLSQPEYINFELFDAQGKLVQILLRDWIKGKENIFSFNTKDLEKGVYFLKVSGNKNTSISKKIVVQ